MARDGDGRRSEPPLRARYVWPQYRSDWRLTHPLGVKTANGRIAPPEIAETVCIPLIQYLQLCRRYLDPPRTQLMPESACQWFHQSFREHPLSGDPTQRPEWHGASGHEHMAHGNPIPVALTHRKTHYQRSPCASNTTSSAVRGRLPCIGNDTMNAPLSPVSPHLVRRTAPGSKNLALINNVHGWKSPARVRFGAHTSSCSRSFTPCVCAS